jgi:hypothetical protein
MDIFHSDRFFQLWYYTVTHGQLLLRSVKSESDKTQVDLFFKNVKFVGVPVLLKSMRVMEIDPRTIDSDLWSRDLFSSVEGRYFQLSGDGWKGLVVAGFFDWDESEKEHYEESSFLSSSFL